VNLEALLLLLVLGAVNHQISHIITTGVIFEDVRQFVKVRIGGKLGYLVSCHLCCGTWAGLIMAVFTSDVVPLVREPIANAVLVGFAIALIGRVWNEGLALASSKVSEIRARAA